ncbi:MAG: abortive infection system antitoxin AbiGi family protein [Syntrophales bacterium]|jgi:hypothetical protein
MAAPRSRTLFHFTKNLNVLKNIIRRGFFPKYSLEDIAWFVAREIDAVAYPVVSFCDIPLSRITDHVSFYGQYGIGMRRMWGITNGFNPIVYVSETSDLATLMRQISQSCIAAHKADKRETHLDNYRRLVGFCKPLEGKMLVGGQFVSKIFYQESEWRHLATHEAIPNYLSKGEYHNPQILGPANESAAKHCPLKFTPQNVKYIFVRTEDDIPELVSFIHDELAHFPQRDLQTLIAKIVTQDLIANDI